MRKLGPSILSGRRYANVWFALLLAFAAGASCTTEEGVTESAAFRGGMIGGGFG